MRISAIQMNSGCNKAQDLETAARLMEEAIRKDRAQFLALPEMFACIGGNSDLRVENAEDLSHPKKESAYLFLKNFAAKHKVFIHGGSVCEKSEGRYYNTTVVFNPQGECIARYRKIHLFCANITGQICYQESDFFSGGNEIVTYSAESLKIGCSICYDLRFSELYQALHQKNVDVILIPSAFFACTGRDHWRILCQARAIETQAYVVAPNQCGKYKMNDKERSMWGHSIIVDPWGKIIGELENEEGFITAEISPALLEKVHHDLPVALSRKMSTAVFHTSAGNS